MGGAPPEPPASERRAAVLTRRQHLALCAAFLIGIALLLPGLFAPLWIDDVLRTFSTSVDAARWWTWLIEDVHNPLYNVFMRGWIHVFGDSLVSIRVPTAFASLLVALCGSLWAGHRFGGWVGVCFATLLLVNPAFILHATMAKNNMFSVLFATLALICFDLGRHAQRVGGSSAHRWLVPAVVASVLGLYTDWSVLYVLLPLWLAMGVSNARRRDWPALRTLLFAITIVAAASVPLILLKVSQAGELERAYLRHFSLSELWHLLANWMLWGNALLPAPEGRTLIAVFGLFIAGPLFLRGTIELWRTDTGRTLLAVFLLPLARRSWPRRSSTPAIPMRVHTSTRSATCWSSCLSTC